MRLVCEVLRCTDPQCYEVKVRVKADRENYPIRKLCKSCAGKTVASSRVVTIKNMVLS